MVERGGQRRSSRVFTHDSWRAQLATCGRVPEEGGKRAAVGQGLSAPKKRGRKKRRFRPVEEVVVKAVEREVELARKTPKHEDHPNNTGQPSTLPSSSWIPEKRVLEFILDILQRRDKHEIFAEPVDPEEVEGYCEIIEEPMDFGTMRAKLQEGMYTTLEQFEHDVFLISGNAMHFNSSSTIYFRQASAINELSKKIFHALKTDPENFELEFSVTRRRPGRRPQGESRVLDFSSRAKLADNVRASSMTMDVASNSSPCSLYGISRASCSSPNVDRGDYENISGFKDGSKSNFSEAEQRWIYRPWTDFLDENESLVSTVYNSSKLPMHFNQGEIGYTESLMWYVKDLGPTAQMVANRKLQRCNKVPTPNCQIPASSAQQGPTHIKIPTSQNFLHNSSGHSTAHTNTSEGMEIRCAFRDEMGHQGRSSEIQLGSHLPINYVRDLNFPAVGMTNSSNDYLAIMADSSKLDNRVPPAELASVFSQSRLLEFVSRNNHYSGPSSWPFQAMRASSSSGATGSMHDLASYSLGVENEVVAAPGPSRRVSLTQVGPVPEGSQRSLASHSLGVENEVMIARDLSHGVGSTQVGTVSDGPSLGTHSMCGENQATTVPRPSYGVSSAQAGLVLDGSQPNLGSHSLGGENQSMTASWPSYGGSSAQAGPVSEWSLPSLGSISLGGDNHAPGPTYEVSPALAGLVPEQSQHRLWGQQAIVDRSYLQMRGSEMNSWGQNGFMQPELRLGSAPEAAFLEPKGFYEWAPMRRHQAEMSTLALLDNQQPDLALQL